MLRKNIALFGLLFFVPAVGHATDLLAGTRVEIPVEKLFAPEKGFDDNDRIEAVIYGHLPNNCYRLADTVVERGTDSSSFNVKQFATRIDNGMCGAEAANMPPHLLIPVPFTKVVDLGILKAATYHVRYGLGNAMNASRPIDVAPATAPTVDDFLYAAVANALVPEIVNGAQEVKVILSGVLNSTCTHLDFVKLTPENDVIVIQPILKVDPGMVCAQVLLPFQQEINLGKMAPGQYLAHIRAMNGGSVNRVFTVAK